MNRNKAERSNVEDGIFKRLEPYTGRSITEKCLEEHGFRHYSRGRDLALEVDAITGRGTYDVDEDEAEAIRNFFGDDVWMRYVPMSDRELKGNQIYDASFLLGIIRNNDGVIESVRQFVRIGIPFAGELPVMEGMPTPVYYDYMPINYCPRYVVSEMEALFS